MKLGVFDAGGAVITVALCVELYDAAFYCVLRTVATYCTEGRMQCFLVFGTLRTYW